MKFRTLMFILMSSIALTACSPDTDEETATKDPKQTQGSDENIDDVPQPKTDYALIQKLEEQERQDLNSRLDLNNFSSIDTKGESVTEQQFYANGNQIMAIDERVSEGGIIISRASFVFNDNRLYAYRYDSEATLNGKPTSFSTRALINPETSDPVQFTKKINNTVTPLKKDELGTILARGKLLNYKAQNILQKRAEIAQAKPTQMKGIFISAVDTQIFMPCFSDQVMWVDSSSPALAGMKTSYSRVTKSPYQEAFATVTAKPVNDTNDAINVNDYSGFLVINGVEKMSAMSPGLCGDPDQSDQ